MKKGILLIVLNVILMFSVLASFTYIDNDLKKTYNAGEKISGTVDISFNNENVNNIVSSNIPSEINLSILDFLYKHNYTETVDFTCSNVGCGNDYSHSGNGVSEVRITNTEKSVGFVITGLEDVSVVSLSLKMQSDAVNSCFRQVAIDIADQGKNLISNTKYNDENCGLENYGCFEDNLGAAKYVDAIIQTNSDYCEKVTLPPAPAYKVGAKIENSTSGSGVLKMSMYDEDGDFLNDCVLPKNQETIEKLECIIETPRVEQRDYYVCVSLNGIANYKIKSETQNPCGTRSPGSNNFVSDYEIFARSLEYDSVDIEINDSTFNIFNKGDLGEVTLGSYVDSFIQQKYNRKCIPNCIIPIRFIGFNQDISLSEAKLEFNTAGSGNEVSTIFDLSVEESTLSSNLISLDMEKAEFEIPLGSEEDIFSLFFGGDSVFLESINITPSFSFGILPTFVAFGQETNFRIDSNFSIIESTWNFGDGSTITENGNNASHIYLESGLFDVEVKAIRSDGVVSTRSFNILVGSAKEVANITINDNKNLISKLEQEIGNLKPLIRNEIQKLIDIPSMKSDLDDIELKYNVENATEEIYNEVIQDLILLNIPFSIRKSKEGTLPILIGANEIDTGLIKSVSSQVVEDDNILEGVIVSWMDRNLDSVIIVDQYSASYGDGSEETLLSYFNIETRPKNDIENSFLFINLGKSAIRFGQNYGEKSVESGTYIDIGSGNENRIYEFVIIGKVEADQLGAYISPVIDSLGDFDFELATCNLNGVCDVSRGEDWRNCRDDCKPWGRFGIWIGVLLFVTLIIYIAMQEWYKRNYEKSLFKKHNDLYNLINFIYNAREIGLADGDIRKKLKKTGWKGEKISYALKKIDGKRVGMWELPVFKFAENKKVRHELEKRHGGKIDARFIKRSGFKN